MASENQAYFWERPRPVVGLGPTCQLVSGLGVEAELGGGGGGWA